ncbi:NAD(P)-dependent dehydrogenase, short-chain alcohol dehydrogenase family [Kytococcus aerolatus]|uniref:NAD(P)-dependent dehydrogenase, short-chain alcohol dehydrogenase family n=1 Tax=Kytococcus aerolatus TaxID=592308 RepID=A0A212TZJ1_9MICO|nr:SDR family oxidoreductase [Kytococcus aerolatus]SNC71399.1 NAD(P)-dependent dehydrogenase, short-chain alcohol dehydrogenase family [Kytococcus aerolatus]
MEEAAPEAELQLVTADVTDEAQVQAYVDRHREAYGSIDGFFNNAGIEGRQNLTEDFTNAEFQKVLAVNLTGVFLGMEKVLAVMAEQGSGSIVNCASVGGIRGVGNQSGYAAAKHGVVGLTRNSAVEYGTKGVVINAIAPGAIMTAMVEGSLRQMGGDDWEKVGEEFVKPNPMQRFGKPEEVAALVCFLLGNEAGFVDGTVIPIDGGQHIKY